MNLEPLRELDWTSYADRKPEAEGYYRWRMPSRAVPGAIVEITAEFRERGAGYTRILSPSFDHWDGYRVHVPEGTEWAPLDVQPDKKASIRSIENPLIVGLDNAPCPYCGNVPTWEASQRPASGGIVCNPVPSRLNSWRLVCCGFGRTPEYDDPRKLTEYRNEKLSRALAQLDDGWRPISEAPKDGSWIVLWHAEGDGTQLIAQWHINCWWGQRTVSGRAITWREATHFRPLPSPPAQDPQP